MFDQPLRGTLTDWVGLDVLSPASTLHTNFSEDRRSCSIDVHLDPGHVYICALNERGLPGVGFQNQKGISLAPTFLVFQTAGNPAPDDTPPALIRAIPENAAQGIDAAKLSAITLVFDRPMNGKKHGLHLSEGGNQVDVPRLQFGYSADGRTFTLPYRFKPATQYRLELNNNHDIGFSSAKRVPMWPVQISFTTR
jgi:hypothetical protein